MPDRTKLYFLNPLSTALMFTQGHRIMGKLEFVQSVCWYVTWGNSNLHDGWLCKGGDWEETRYKVYGSYKHLLFLFYLLKGEWPPVGTPVYKLCRLSRVKKKFLTRSNLTCCSNSLLRTALFSFWFWLRWVSYLSMQWVVFVRPSCVAKKQTNHHPPPPPPQKKTPKKQNKTKSNNNKKPLIFDIYMRTVQPFFFHTFYAYRHKWLLPFYTTFTDLDLAWGSQGQREVKTLGFIFSHTFYLIMKKFNVMMKNSS